MRLVMLFLLAGALVCPASDKSKGKGGNDANCVSDCIAKRCTRSYENCIKNAKNPTAAKQCVKSKEVCVSTCKSKECAK